MLTALFRGAALGLSIAAPFGPVALLCIQRSLVGGPALGVLSGLGAASAHGLFATLAMTAADLASALLTRWHGEIHAASALVLMGLGVRTLWRRRGAGAGTARPQRGQVAYPNGLLLALSNPMTALPYLALAGSLQAGPLRADWAACMVSGAMLGASAWYAVLSSSAGLLSQRLLRALIPRLSSAAGVTMIGLGVLTAMG